MSPGISIQISGSLQYPQLHLRRPVCRDVAGRGHGRRFTAVRGDGETDAPATMGLPRGRKIPGQYDVMDLGFNYRMSELHAALGIEQLKRLPEFIHKRKRNYEALGESLDELEGIAVREYSRQLPEQSLLSRCSAERCAG